MFNLYVLFTLVVCSVTLAFIVWPKPGYRLKVAKKRRIKQLVSDLEERALGAAERGEPCIVCKSCPSHLEGAVVCGLRNKGYNATVRWDGNDWGILVTL